MKVKYSFKTVSALHTGASHKYGTLTPFNRVPVRLKNPISYQSKFDKTDSQEKLKREAIALIILKLWERMPSKARVTIYDELADHLLSASGASSKYTFLDLLAEKLKVRSVTEAEGKSRLDIVDLLDLFNNQELLETIRNEHQYIIAIFRKLKDDNKEFRKEIKEAKKGEISRETILITESGLFDYVGSIEEQLEKVILQPSTTNTVVKRIDYVPEFRANSIRGVLRRLAMYDYLKLAGFITQATPKEIAETISNEDSSDKQYQALLTKQLGLPISLYHTLFTGGVIKDSKGLEDIQEREDLIALCPMIGLLGTAKGNGTVQGTLSVYEGKLKCSENGFEDEPSYHSLLNVEMGSRLDSSKNETILYLVGTKDEKESANQMKYEFENIIAGATLESGFELNTQNLLLISAFWQLISLFKENPIIGGRVSKGYGRIDLSELEVPTGATKLYVEWITKSKKEIQSKFGVSRNV